MLLRTLPWSAAPAAGPDCGSCRSFCADPLEIERLTPGLASLSSGFAAVRAQDGICRLHARFLSARSHCAAFQDRTAPANADAI